MVASERAKPATVSSEPAPNFEQLGGPLISQVTIDPAFIQASRLTRLYALTYDQATTIAILAYAVIR